MGTKTRPTHERRLGPVGAPCPPMIELRTRWFRRGGPRGRGPLQRLRGKSPRCSNSEESLAQTDLLRIGPLGPVIRLVQVGVFKDLGAPAPRG